jgi:hypothetical protein
MTETAATPPVDPNAADFNKTTELPVSIFDVFETDISAEEEGRWFDGFGAEGIRIKLRRLSSRKAMAVRQRLARRYRSSAKNGVLPQDIQDTILRTTVAEGCFVDWEGINDRSGKPIKFSPEAALELMTKLPNFAKAVTHVCDQLEFWRAEEQAAVEGNS